MTNQPRMWRTSIAAVCLLLIVTTQACAPIAAPPTAANTEAPVSVIEPELVFQTSVTPQPNEDLADACRYEMTLTDSSRQVQGVWVIFERSEDMRRYYEDADVRAFARRHGLALLYPFHCRSKSETGGDMNVVPSMGIGRALFAALDDFVKISGRGELAKAKLILLGFSGTGSLVGRLAEFAPDRVLAVIPTAPSQYDPLGVDTINLSQRAAAIPHLILVGGADAVSGTQRPYAYFRKYFDRDAPWTFVVQNQAPHCCIMNAKALILEWLDAVVAQESTHDVGLYGFIETKPSEATDCPGQSAPVRRTWCRSTTDIWGGQNWSVNAATVERRPNSPEGMMPSGWLPTDAFAALWLSFVRRSEYPITMPP